MSVALTGTEDLATELRLRTAIDMALNSEIYQCRQDYRDLIFVSPDYDEALKSCCSDGSYSP